MGLDAPFFLSELDEDLVGKGSSRDGLGFMILWSELGHRILPTLTEQTGTLSGFQVLVSGLQAHLEFSAQSDEPPEVFFRIWEQLCAFSVCLVKNDIDKYPLPGKRALNNLQGNFVLSPKTKLLQDQMSSGVWGLFRHAATIAKLISFKTSPGMRHKWYGLSQGVQASVLKSKKLLFETIQRALKEDSDVVRISNRHTSYLALIQEISDLVLKIPDKKLLLDHILPEDTVRRKMAQKYLGPNFRSENKTQEQIKRKFVEQCKKEFEDKTQDFENILKCENYISILAILFEQMSSCNGQNIANVAEKFHRLNPKQLKEARDQYKNVRYDSSQGEKNKNIFCENIRFGSTEEILRSLVECHEEIASSEIRKFMPWVEIDAKGYISTTLNSENGRDDDICKNLEVGVPWVHDYYLRPFFSITEEVEKLL